MIILTAFKSKLLNAGPKAQSDVIRILSEDPKYRVRSKAIAGKPGLLWTLRKFFLLASVLFSKDIILLQHPLTQSRMLKLLPSDRTIVLIHDVNFIRMPEDPKNKKEIDNLRHFNCIIAHNQHMKEYLANEGIAEDMIFTNELFDYCCDTPLNLAYVDYIPYNIVYAGNLEKSDFIYQLEENKMKFTLDLYGQGLKEYNNCKITYSGQFQPDELPDDWEGRVGLVWDGNFDESDESYGMKMYTKYNTPHKLSCYIAAGIPVIVWRKAAVADFVLQNNIGYVISSLYDINELDFSDYDEKRKNVLKISEKVRSGYYTRRVIDKILGSMN